MWLTLDRSIRESSWLEADPFVPVACGTAELGSERGAAWLTGFCLERFALRCGFLEP